MRNSHVHQVFLFILFLSSDKLANWGMYLATAFVSRKSLEMPFSFRHKQIERILFDAHFHPVGDSSVLSLKESNSLKNIDAL